MIIYVTLASFVLAIATTSIVNLINIYRKSKDIGNIETSAVSAMDRMMREIRTAYAVDTSVSCLYDPPLLDGCDPDIGILKLKKLVSGVERNVRFYVSNNRIMIDQDGVLLGPLTSANTSVDYLKFRRSATSTAEALRVEMSLQSNIDSDNTHQFYDTAVMRGSYQ